MTVREEFLRRTREALLARREPDGTWRGHLSSSALSTATACIALLTVDARRYRDDVVAGINWLVTHQNSDGGWGDTTKSRSNLSTTWMGYCALTAWAGCGELTSSQQAAFDAAQTWLTERLDSETLSADALAAGLRSVYGADRTFQVPLLVAGVIAGALGPEAAKQAGRLPFELAVFPHRVLRWLKLPVVSYALPALVAMGQWIEHQHGGGRFWRRWLVGPTRRKLRTIQPTSGGFLEAAPLTSFVAMALADIGASDDPVVTNCVAFLQSSQRPDGAWPIDEDLSTWVTSLSASALAEELPEAERVALVDSILARQQRGVHPFTQTAKGGWSWTDRSGGVPDADDTSAALLALDALTTYWRDHSVVADYRDHAQERRVLLAVRAGVKWLLGVQNSDGGFPTFCKGWGLLPFDQSCCDITAHAVAAMGAWRTKITSGSLCRRMEKPIARGLKFLRTQQEADGRWVPLWFGNEQAADQRNGVYGTSRVVALLAKKVSAHEQITTGRQYVLAEAGADSDLADMIFGGQAYLLAQQNSDGGWGGELGCDSSIEETALALAALRETGGLPEKIYLGHEWLQAATENGTNFPATPIGLYFASLWYYEELYPLLFTAGALGAL